MTIAHLVQGLAGGAGCYLGLVFFTDESTSSAAPHGLAAAALLTLTSAGVAALRGHQERQGDGL